MSSGCSPAVGSSSRKIVWVGRSGRLSAAVDRRQESRQLQSLGLAAGKRRDRLARAEIVQSDIEHRPEPCLNLGAIAKEPKRLAHGQVEHLGDVLAAVGDLEDFRPVRACPALGAADHHIGKKLHVDREKAVPLTGIAAAPLDVEAESARVVVPQLGLVSRGERLANLVKCLQMRDRV